MSMLRRLFHLRLWGPPVDDAVDWEIEHHIEERVEELRSTGMSEAQARAEARRAFGDRARLRSELRRIDRGVRRRERLTAFIGTVRQDLRYGARALAVNRGFALGVILTLGLGIGANSALFSVADALVFRPLPFTQPEELLEVYQTSGKDQRGRPYLDPGIVRGWLSDQAVATAAFMHARTTATYVGGAEPVDLPGLAVTDAFEETLGVLPQPGRGLMPEDTRVGAAPVVLISFEFWQRAFGGSDVLGTIVQLDGVQHEIVGVMPRGFKYPLYSTSDFWVPIRADDAYLSTQARMVGLVARIQRGDFAAAEAGASTLARSLLQQDDPRSEADWRFQQLDDSRLATIELRRSLTMLAAAVALTLLIAGVNMVSLLLLRGAARTRELALRLALGASRARLVRQLATEALLLALCSGVLAALIGRITLRLLQSRLPASIAFWSPHPITFEQRTLVFTFVVALASGLVFGLLPAMRVTRMAGSKAGTGLAPRASVNSTASAGLRRALVASEVAIAVTLLVTAALLMASFVRLTRVDPGVDLERLAVLDLSVSSSEYPQPEARAAYFNRIAERIRALPGVDDVAITGGMPPHGGISFDLTFETDDGIKRPLEGFFPFTNVGPDFFRVTGARLLAGRPFHPGEDDASGAVIIDEDLAHHLWPGSSAIGQRFRTDPEADWQTVVGVMADLKLIGPDDRTGNFEVLYPLDRFQHVNAGIAIRARGDPGAVLPDVRRTVHDINPTQVISRLDRAATIYAGSLDLPRFLFVIITSLAVVALLLAAIGIYSLLSYGVARRYREIGVRLALGAEAKQVRWLVVGEALVLVLTGTAVGMLSALAASRIVQGALYGVSATDSRVYTLVAAMVLSVAVIATVAPVQRALRVDPVKVLRTD